MGEWNCVLETSDLWMLSGLLFNVLALLVTLHQPLNTSKLARIMLSFAGTSLVWCAQSWWPAWVGTTLVFAASLGTGEAKGQHRQILQDGVALLFLVAAGYAGDATVGAPCLLMGLLMLSKAFPFTGWVQERHYQVLDESFLRLALFPAWAALGWFQLAHSQMRDALSVPWVEYALLAVATLTACVAAVQNEMTRALHLTLRAWLVVCMLATLVMGRNVGSQVWLTVQAGIAMLFCLSVWKHTETSPIQKTPNRNAIRAVAILLGWSAMNGFGGRGSVLYFNPAYSWIWGVVAGFLSVPLVRCIGMVWRTPSWKSPSSWTWMVWGLVLLSATQPLGAILDETLLKQEHVVMDWEIAAIQYVPIFLAAWIVGLLIPAHLPLKVYVERDPVERMLAIISKQMRRLSLWIQNARAPSKPKERRQLARIQGTVQRYENRWVESGEHRLTSLLDAGGRSFQAIQNGNLQWYLFFAIGSGISLLVHFLKSP